MSNYRNSDKNELVLNVVAIDVEQPFSNCSSQRNVVNTDNSMCTCKMCLAVSDTRNLLLNKLHIDEVTTCYIKVFAYFSL